MNHFLLRINTLFFCLALFSFSYGQEVPNVSPEQVENNELLIEWDAIIGSLGYDVEWTWVDGYNEDITSTNLRPKSDISFTQKDFDYNNTRIQTQNTNYLIPLTYAKGYVIFRVRSISLHEGTTDRYDYSDWSTGADEKLTLDDWDNDAVHIIEEDHAINLNWQYQSSFAEQGKKKEVVSYFDGTLRNRQTVTKINTDQHIVVGEVIYDAQGRPAVEVLPVPTISNEIGYVDDFTKDSSEGVYNYEDFDKDTENDLTSGVVSQKAMSKTSGASKYYSDANDVEGPHQAYIPNADGYPFSQIEYTPDNTGRVRRKSGVGKTHQLGNEHEMEYYYGAPEQKELNRLFGYSVGNASHYKKNLVLDPNDQASVSYIDPQGRTIATALADYAPISGNLEGLDDEKDVNEELHKTVTTDLLDKLSSNDVDTSVDKNNKQASGNYGVQNDKLTYSASKLAPSDTKRTLVYTVNHPQPEYSYDCDTEGYPIIYDLNLSVLDRDGNELTVGDFATTKSITASATEISLEENELGIPRGSYTISKKLQVNKDKLEEYADTFISKYTDETSVCYIGEENSVFFPAISFDDCFTSSEECRDSLIGSFSSAEAAADNFAEEESEAYDLSHLSFLSDQELALERENLRKAFKQQYLDLIAACDNTEETQTTPLFCDNVTYKLLDDMKPIGQYGIKVSDNGALSNNTSALNIYNENNQLFTANAGGEFNSWRNPHHPEYDGTYAKGTLLTNGHYYDENGQISYIKVDVVITYITENDSETGEEIEVEQKSYNPEILDTIDEENIKTIDGVSDTVYVEPQYLKNLSDLIAIDSSGTTTTDLWQNSWTESLIIYHPEYAYAEFSEDLCNHVVGEKNSDGYDIELQNLEFADTIENGVVLKTGADALGYLDSFNFILDNDPYFSNATASTKLSQLDPSNHRRAVMLQALTDDFNASGDTMAKYVLGVNNCNSIVNCEDEISGGSMTGIVGQADDKEEFWATYKTNYLSLKDRIKTAMIDAYAIGQGNYNGCIGANKPDYFTDIISDYDAANSIYNLANTNVNNLCDSNTEINRYVNKQQRFVPSDNEYDTSASNEQIGEDIQRFVDREYYIETGLCPMGRDLQLYLDFLFRDAKYASLINTAGSDQYEESYMSRALYTDLGGVLPTDDSFNIAFEQEGNTLNIDAERNGTPLAGEPEDDEYVPGISITLSNNNYSWSNYGEGSWVITKLDQMKPDYNETSETFTYSAVAQVKTNSTDVDYKEVVVSGTTIARIAMCTLGQANGIGQFLVESGAENSDNGCSTQIDFNSQMTNLIQDIQQTGDVNNTNVNITTLLAKYSVLNNATIFGSETAIWNANESTYTITVGGEEKLVMELETPLTNSAISRFESSYQYGTNGKIGAHSVRIIGSRSFGGGLAALFGISRTTRYIGTLTHDGSQFINLLCCGDINDSVETVEECGENVCENEEQELLFEEFMLKVFQYAVDNHPYDYISDEPGYGFSFPFNDAALINEYNEKINLEGKISTFVNNLYPDDNFTVDISSPVYTINSYDTCDCRGFYLNFPLNSIDDEITASFSIAFGWDNSPSDSFDSFIFNTYVNPDPENWPDVEKPFCYDITQNDSESGISTSSGYYYSYPYTTVSTVNNSYNYYSYLGISRYDGEIYDRSTSVDFCGFLDAPVEVCSPKQGVNCTDNPVTETLYEEYLAEMLDLIVKDAAVRGEGNVSNIVFQNSEYSQQLFDELHLAERLTSRIGDTTTNDLSTYDFENPVYRIWNYYNAEWVEGVYDFRFYKDFQNNSYDHYVQTRLFPVYDYDNDQSSPYQIGSGDFKEVLCYDLQVEEDGKAYLDVTFLTENTSDIGVFPVLSSDVSSLDANSGTRRIRFEVQTNNRDDSSTYYEEDYCGFLSDFDTDDEIEVPPCIDLPERIVDMDNFLKLVLNDIVVLGENFTGSFTSDNFKQFIEGMGIGFSSDSTFFWSHLNNSSISSDWFRVTNSYYGTTYLYDFNFGNEGALTYETFYRISQITSVQFQSIVGRKYSFEVDYITDSGETGTTIIGLTGTEYFRLEGVSTSTNTFLQPCDYIDGDQVLNSCATATGIDEDGNGIDDGCEDTAIVDLPDCIENADSFVSFHENLKDVFNEIVSFDLEVLEGRFSPLFPNDNDIYQSLSFTNFITEQNLGLPYSNDDTYYFVKDDITIYVHNSTMLNDIHNSSGNKYNNYRFMFHHLDLTDEEFSEIVEVIEVEFHSIIANSYRFNMSYITSLGESKNTTIAVEFYERFYFENFKSHTLSTIYPCDYLDGDATFVSCEFPSFLDVNDNGIDDACENSSTVLTEEIDFSSTTETVSSVASKEFLTNTFFTSEDADLDALGIYIQNVTSEENQFSRTISSDSNDISLSSLGVANSSFSTSSSISSSDCYDDVCIPTIPTPISCSDKYPIYEDLMQNRFGGDGIDNFSDMLAAEMVDEATFCDFKFAYILDDYITYLDALSINGNLTYEDGEVVSGFSHPNYVSIGQFGATPFNYGYEGIGDLIARFAILVNDTPAGESTPKWHNFTRDEFDNLLSTDGVTPCEIPNPYLVPMDTIEVPDAPSVCEQFQASVLGSYQSDNLDKFLATKREEFIQGYLSQAVDNVVENFTMAYADKEYQYTLYYYDQAGNLLQTVPPEGVDRFSDEELESGINDQINQHRANNTDIDNIALLPEHNLVTEYRYNSLNQLVWQKTPDGGETTFAYDDLGRIIASQNAKQVEQINDARCEKEEVEAINTNFQIAAQNNIGINDGVLNAESEPTLEDNLTVAQLSIPLTNDGYIEFTVDSGYRKTIEEEVTETVQVTEDVLDENGNPTGETITTEQEVTTTVRSTELAQLSYVGLTPGSAATEVADLIYGIKTSVDNHTFYTPGVPVLGNNNGDDHIRLERLAGKVYVYINGTIARSIDDPSSGDLLINFIYLDGKNAYTDIIVANFYGNANCPTSDMSYTVYDELGRITEAGEMTPSYDLTINDEKGKLAYDFDARTVTTNIEEAFPRNVSNEQKQVTKTVYSDAVIDAELIFNAYDAETYADNIRNRVAAIYYYDIQDKTTPLSAYNSAIYYNYDIHGNVKEIVSHNKLLSIGEDNFYSGVKHVNYEYDLISGNVNKVIYQKGMIDQFIHQYNYDADNRITSVQTSSDGITWETDAEYQYYAHGPLARVLIGEEKVQAMDYAYTLQGWLKGVNSEGVGTIDMGNDGDEVGADVFAYSLNYYDGDYDPITATNPFVIAQEQNVNTKDLYNGNIKTMVTSLLDINEEPLSTLQSNYGYDQLNRIKDYKAYALGSTETSYEATYDFDRNGNLTALTRKEDDNTFDDFNYEYQKETMTDGRETIKTNQLLTVQDTEGQKLDSDLLDQFAALGIPADAFDQKNENHHNYVYDEIGQLIEDKTEGLTIGWRVDGKVDKVIKNDGTEITFIYDGLGRRMSKMVVNGDSISQTHYVRDVQGNVMAVYDEKEEDGFQLKEHHIYGSSRLGLQESDIIVSNTETDALSDTVIIENKVGDKRYEFSNHLGNVLSVITDSKLTGNTETEVYTQDFTTDIGTWVASVNAESATIEEGQLKIVTAKNLNGANGYYNLEANKTYNIQLYVDITEFNVPLEFGIWEGNSKKYGEYIEESGLLTTTFTPTSTREYRLNFRLRESGYTGEAQTVYVDNLGITYQNPVGSFNEVIYTNDFTDLENINDDNEWNPNGSSIVTTTGQLEIEVDDIDEGVAYFMLTEPGDEYTVSYDLALTSSRPIAVQAVEGTPDAPILVQKTDSTTGNQVLEFTATSVVSYIKWVRVAPEDGIVETFSIDNVSVSQKASSALGDIFTANVVAYNDYYPFGMFLPNRHRNSSDYRYGFNGKEKDDEIMGEGNSYDFGMRFYNNRIGRWMSTDPFEMKYAFISPYSFAANNPLTIVDPDGAEIKPSEILKDKLGIEIPPLAAGILDGAASNIGWLSVISTGKEVYDLVTDSSKREAIIEGIKAFANDPMGTIKQMGQEYVDKFERIMSGNATDQDMYDMGYEGGALASGGGIKLLLRKITKVGRNKLTKTKVGGPPDKSKTMGDSGSGSLVDPGCPLCFTGDTYVKTERGNILIQDIKVGATVMVYNPSSQIIEEKEVLGKQEVEVGEIYIVELENETLKLPKGYVFIIGGKFVNVEDLNEGDQVELINGKFTTVSKLSVKKGSFKVYDLKF